MFRQLDTDLWVAERPFRYFGAEVGVRMTAIRLAEGGLLLHSPVRLDEATRAELAEIGPVRFIVAPNRFHHLFAGDYPRAYPQARLLGAPGLELKRKDLKFDAILGDTPAPGLENEFDQIVFRAFSPLNEVVFLHRRSRTVLFTDLMFNVTKSDSAYTRFLLTLDGGYGKLAVPRTFRFAIRMRGARAREELESILRWDFDRLIVAHGDVVESGAREAVRDAWSFLQPGRT